MNFAQSVETCFRKYGRFEGRAPRSEFWWWYVFSVITSMIANVLFEFGGLLQENGFDSGFIVFLLGVGVSFAFMIPSLSVGARRLHDTGKSGWWMFFPLTIIGIIPVIIWFASAGDEEKNEYGPPP